MATTQTVPTQVADLTEDQRKTRAMLKVAFAGDAPKQAAIAALMDGGKPLDEAILEYVMASTGTVTEPVKPAAKPSAGNGLQAEIERLRAENDMLRKKQTAKATVTAHIGESGAISVYGIGGRFPVTLYVEAWERLKAELADGADLWQQIMALVKAGSETRTVDDRDSAGKKLGTSKVVTYQLSRK